MARPVFKKEKLHSLGPACSATKTLAIHWVVPNPAIRQTNRGKNAIVHLQSTVIRVAAVVPLTSAIGVPLPTAS